MWTYDSTPDASEPCEVNGGDSRPQDRGVGRYRAYGRFYERYWCKLFGVTQADMVRCAAQMRVSGAALTLTELARDLIAARLRQGPQLQSGPAAAVEVRPAGMPRPSATRVARWDPGETWQAGDRVILATRGASGHPPAPSVGEITEVHPDCVVIHVDGVSGPQVLSRDLDRAVEGVGVTDAEMQALTDLSDEDAQISFVLWAYGTYVVERLWHALETDPRFVTLEGRWSLREVASRPTEEALARLAAVLFDEDRGPLTMSEAVALVPSVGVGSFARRLGLALALRERPDLFRNIGTFSYPRWELAGPPPIALTATCAVYDPDTYAILCLPGETLSRTVSQRLWDLALLRTATVPRDTPADQPEADASQRRPSGGAPAASRAADPETAGGVDFQGMPTEDAPTVGATTETRVWPRWLRFSRQ